MFLYAYEEVKMSNLMANLISMNNSSQYLTFTKKATTGFMNSTFVNLYRYIAFTTVVYLIRLYGLAP